ncbi:MAG: hypothetical protein R3325_00560 [Thermoanaerobaculia bacterium]|nr:hypothetical protein [Thermoanaerobaculia bacterium]
MRSSPKLLGPLLGLVAASVWAQAPIRVAQAPNSTAPLAWIETVEGAWVEGPAGRVVTVELPPGAGIERLAATRRGWIAAGVRPDPPGQEIYLLESKEGVLSELPALPPRVGAARGQPLPVMRGLELAGLLWLVGGRYDELTVWAAAWTGTGWGRPEEVSPPATGQQTGLAAAVLEDGSWLAVWAADDLEGDAEILWSRRGEAGWSPPAQLNPPNRVPDYAVTVAATRGGGALVVWNTFDGQDYRLRQARLLPNGGWALTGAFGRKGSHRPYFLAGAQGLALVYREAERAAWVVQEVGAAGAAGRHSVISGTPAVPPLVDLLDPDAPRAIWPAGVLGEAAIDAVAPWGPPQ